MLDLKNSFISHPPFGKSDLFDLSCGYLRTLFEKIDSDYRNLITYSEIINRTLPVRDSKIFISCYWYVDSIIDIYSRIVRITNLSLGEQVGRTIPNEKIFIKPLNYEPNETLHKNIKKIRNSSQHLEERFHEYLNDINPFIKLFYEGKHIQWNISFGKGGYSSVGSIDDSGSIDFVVDKLNFSSFYEKNGKIHPMIINIGEIQKDLNEILSLVNFNIERVIKENKSGVPSPPTNIGLFSSPRKK